MASIDYSGICDDLKMIRSLLQKFDETIVRYCDSRLACSQQFAEADVEVRLEDVHDAEEVTEYEADSTLASENSNTVVDSEVWSEIGTSLNSVSFDSIVVSIGSLETVDTSLDTVIVDKKTLQNKAAQVFDKTPKLRKSSFLYATSHFHRNNSNNLPCPGLIVAAISAKTQFTVGNSAQELDLSIVDLNTRGMAIASNVNALHMLLHFPFDPGSCMFTSIQSNGLIAGMVLNVSLSFSILQSWSSYIRIFEGILNMTAVFDFINSRRNSSLVAAQCMLFSFPFDPGSYMLTTINSKVMPKVVFFKMLLGFRYFQTGSNHLRTYDGLFIVPPVLDLANFSHNLVSYEMFEGTFQQYSCLVARLLICWYVKEVEIDVECSSTVVCSSIYKLLERTSLLYSSDGNHVIGSYRDGLIDMLLNKCILTWDIQSTGYWGHYKGKRSLWEFSVCTLVVHTYAFLEYNKELCTMTPFSSALEHFLVNFIPNALCSITHMHVHSPFGVIIEVLQLSNGTFISLIFNLIQQAVVLILKLEEHLRLTVTSIYGHEITLCVGDTPKSHLLKVLLAWILGVPCFWNENHTSQDSLFVYTTGGYCDDENCEWLEQCLANLDSCIASLCPCLNINSSKECIPLLDKEKKATQVMGWIVTEIFFQNAAPSSFMLLYPNLEDKVLIENEGIVVNLPFSYYIVGLISNSKKILGPSSHKRKGQLIKQPNKLSQGLIWDPG